MIIIVARLSGGYQYDNRFFDKGQTPLAFNKPTYILERILVKNLFRQLWNMDEVTYMKTKFRQKHWENHRAEYIFNSHVFKFFKTRYLLSFLPIIKK